MSYDIHIVRTDNWFDAESYPISKEDVDRLLTSQADLQWSTTDYIAMREPDDSIQRYYAILWNGEPTFLWYKTEIRCATPSDAQIIRMVQMAQHLGAKVVGDEGEQYELAPSSAGQQTLVIKNLSRKFGWLARCKMALQKVFRHP